MPFSSSSFTRLASEKRGGGWVKCWSVSSFVERERLALLEGRKRGRLGTGAVAALVRGLGPSPRRGSS